MTWTIVYVPEVSNDYKSLDGSVRRQVQKAINKAAANPLPRDTKGTDPFVSRSDTKGSVPFVSLEQYQYFASSKYRDIVHKGALWQPWPQIAAWQCRMGRSCRSFMQEALRWARQGASVLLGVR